MASDWNPTPPRGLTQLFQKLPGSFEIARLQPFGKATTKRRQQLTSLVATALPQSKPRKRASYDRCIRVTQLEAASTRGGAVHE